MKKSIILFLIFLMFFGANNSIAQGMSSSASQTIHIVIPPRISIINDGTINTASAKNQFKVNSNKKYTIQVGGGNVNARLPKEDNQLFDSYDTFMLSLKSEHNVLALSTGTRGKKHTENKNNRTYTVTQL